MPRTSVLRLADVAVIVLVCKVAAWAVLRNRFVDSPGEAHILVWYGLAGLYALAAWAYTVSRQWLSLLLLSLGTLAAPWFLLGMAAWSLSMVVTWLDWALLACAFVFRLAASWCFRHVPNDDNQI